MKKVLLILFIIFCFHFSFSQELEWVKMFGGSSFEFRGNSVQIENGVIMLGETTSNDGDIVGGNTEPHYDGWVVKLDENGLIVWQSIISDFSHDIGLHEVIETSDGGFIVVGVVDAPGGQLDYKALVVKLNSEGVIQWERVYGGSSIDSANGVVEMPDNTLLVLINTTSTDGDVPENNGYYDFLLLNLSQEGDIIWSKVYGGLGKDVAGKINKISDTEYLLMGNSDSHLGEFSDNHGIYDALFIMVNELGETQWIKMIGGNREDIISKIIKSQEGGYLSIGYSKSNTDDVPDNLGEIDVWMIKFSEEFDIVWTKSYGGIGNDIFSSVVQTVQGDYLISGYTDSLEGFFSTQFGNDDAFFSKANDLGEIEWIKYLGGSESDYAKSVNLISNDKLFISGDTYSEDGLFEESKGNSDLWVMKFGSFLSIDEFENERILLIPNPVNKKLFFSEKLFNIEIYNLSGQLVKKINMANELNVDSLIIGTYILKARRKNGEIFQSKFIKN